MFSHEHVAYLILAHADLPHLRRLVAALPQESIKLVHLDRKCTAQSSLGDLSNAAVLKERLPVYWGDFSIVEATLRLLAAALELHQVKRLVLLSGNCYPIKSDGHILDFFSSHPDDNFIRMFKIEGASALYRDKLSRPYVGESSIARAIGTESPRVNYLLSRGLSRMSSLRKVDWRRRLGSIKPYFGSQWWAITRPCGEYALEQARTLSGLRHFERCFAPDEMYFHTIVGNSPFVGSQNVIPFEGRGNWRLANLHLINAGSLRYVFGISDLDTVLQSGKLFVRKVNTERSTELLDALDANRGKAVAPLAAAFEDDGIVPGGKHRAPFQLPQKDGVVEIGPS